MARKKKRSIRATPIAVTSKQQTKNSYLKSAFIWLGSTGLLLAVLAGIYQYCFASVNLEFLQPVGRAYEFQLKNDTPADWVVRSFRVVPPRPQQVIYRTTEDVYASVLPTGEVVLPGGNASYVPAAEYKELDGQRILANSAQKFRIPPLSSRPWMEPVASIVDIDYELTPANRILAGAEWMASQAGLQSSFKSKRYIVVDNYWISSNSSSIKEALRVACRDNDSLARSGSCK